MFTRAQLQGRRLKRNETRQGKIVHSLRRGGITAWIEANVNVAVAMWSSEHKRASTLGRYAHLVGDRVN